MSIIHCLKKADNYLVGSGDIIINYILKLHENVKHMQKKTSLSIIQFLIIL